MLAARGQFEVLPDLPDYARQGLFAAPKTYPALVRLSNASMDVCANAKPDIRGFAVKVEGVDGPAALGGTANCQDFLMVNQEAFASPTSDEFVEVVAAASSGPAASDLAFVARARPAGRALAPEKLAGDVGAAFFRLRDGNVQRPRRDLRRPLRRAFPRFAGADERARPSDYADDMRNRLAAGPVVYDFQLQFFIGEATTPIEDTTKPWPEARAPYVTVARLTLTGLADDVEGLRFDPWGGLAAHRPLGEIMRARKAAYFESQKARGAA